MFGVGQITESHISPGKCCDPCLLFQLLVQSLSKISVHGFMSCIQGCPEERKAYQIILWYNSRNNGIIQCSHFKISDPHGLHILCQGAQLGIGIKFHSDIPIAGVLQRILELLYKCFVGRMGFCHIVSQADRNRICGSDLCFKPRIGRSRIGSIRLRILCLGL